MSVVRAQLPLQIGRGTQPSMAEIPGISLPPPRKWRWPDLRTPPPRWRRQTRPRCRSCCIWDLIASAEDVAPVGSQDASAPTMTANEAMAPTMDTQQGMKAIFDDEPVLNTIDTMESF